MKTTAATNADASRRISGNSAFRKESETTFELKPRRTPGAKRIRDSELPVFTRALSAMLSAGLPALQCLRALEEQTESRIFKSVINNIRLAVQYGNKLSTAMSLFPDVFDRMYTSMLKTGEVSGRLAETLESLALQLEESADLRRKVQSALMYPIAVAVVACLLATGMMLWIVPAFEKIYQSLGGTLPMATSALIYVSSVLRNNGLGVAVALTLISLAVGRWRRTNSGAYAWDRCVFLVPVFGPMLLKVALARFSESMSQMLRHGIPILQALSLGSEVVGNRVIGHDLAQIATAVEHGETLSASLHKSRWFPPLLVHMIATGEKTGRMDDMLERVASFYRSEVTVMLRGITSLVEPMLIVVLGVVIGGMVVCMFIPIFRLHELVKF